MTTGSRNANDAISLAQTTEGALKEVTNNLQRSATVQDITSADGATDAQATPDNAEVTDLGLIPATQVKPEEVGTLSLRYVDGVPQLVVSGGNAIPASLTVVDASGKVVARYTAAPIEAVTAARSHQLTLTNEAAIDGSVTVTVRYL